MEKRDINGEKGVQITNVAKQIEVKFLGQNYDYEFKGLYMALIFLLRD